jgi:hypothetical protein
MNMCEDLMAGLLAGFLFPADRTPAQANLQIDGTGATSQEGAPQFIVLFGSLGPETAHKLSLYFKTAEVAGTNPTIEDMRTLQGKALALIARAIQYIETAGPFADTAEYREG